MICCVKDCNNLAGIKVTDRDGKLHGLCHTHEFMMVKKIEKEG